MFGVRICFDCRRRPPADNVGHPQPYFDQPGEIRRDRLEKHCSVRRRQCRCRQRPHRGWRGRCPAAPRRSLPSILGTRWRFGRSTPARRSSNTRRRSAGRRRTSRRGRMSTPTIWSSSSGRMPVVPPSAPVEATEDRQGAHLHGLPPRRRTRRHAQFHRYHRQRELLRDCLPCHCRPGQQAPAAALSRASTVSCRSSTARDAA